MSFLAAIPLIGKLFDKGGEYLETRQQIKKIKLEGEVKLARTRVEGKILQAKSDADSAGNLDEIALKNVGWKDDYLLIVVTIPMILAFIPGMVPYVKAGFIVLEEMPEWFQWMVGGVFIYVFGFKRILLKVMQAFISARFNRASMNSNGPQPLPSKTKDKPPPKDLKSNDWPDDENQGD